MSNLIDSDEAAFLMVDLVKPKPYTIAEQVINCHFSSDEEMLNHFNIATRNMLKHVAKSNRNKS